MSDMLDAGLWAWRQKENHNKLIDLQNADPSVSAKDNGVELSYYGGSAFKITSPGGLSVMIDPWRNPPWGGWDWYLYEFPETVVDIGMSTHAHFDHDALHCLSANMLLDRLVGRFEFADMVITGIADKHVSDTRHSTHDWAALSRKMLGIEPAPPNNPRCFDNSLIIIETGGLRILHWGDNRPDPPEEVWAQLTDIDVALLPVDASRHVLSYEMADTIMQRLGAKLAVPHHYFIWDVTTRGSTLLPADDWVATHTDAILLDAGATTLRADQVKSMQGRVMHFGDHVGFEKPRFGDGFDKGTGAP